MTAMRTSTAPRYVPRMAQSGASSSPDGAVNEGLVSTTAKAKRPFRVTATDVGSPFTGTQPITRGSAGRVRSTRPTSPLAESV